MSFLSFTLLEFLLFLLPPVHFQPTLQPVGDESVCLFAFCHSSAGAAVRLGVGAYDRPSSSFWVQRGIGRGQEAGRVWICCSWVVDVAVPSEAVCVGLT